jgi:hypothetical protein
MTQWHAGKNLLSYITFSIRKRLKNQVATWDFGKKISSTCTLLVYPYDSHSPIILNVKYPLTLTDCRKVFV